MSNPTHFIYRIKRFLTDNPIQKVLAVGIAVLIWAFAPHLDKPNLSQMRIFVPVSYINAPENLEIVSQPQQSVGVTIEIANDEIPNPSLFQVVVNLEDAYPGERTYEITKKALRHPQEVKVLKISPDRLTFVFETTLEKKLAIKPVIVGNPAKGYVLEKVELEPEEVTLNGPKTILESLEQIETKTIDIEGISYNMDVITSINLPERLSLVGPEPEFYKAKIEVGSEPISIRFDDIPIGIVNQEYVTRINPKSFHVLLRGPRSIMQTFSAQDVQAFINLQDYLPGKYKIEASELTLRLRPEIQVQKIWPPIHIWVKKQRIEE